MWIFLGPGNYNKSINNSMPQKVLDGLKEHTPLRRLAQPRGVANAYLFLASEEASFISGAVLRVDGGLVFGT